MAKGKEVATKKNTDVAVPDDIDFAADAANVDDGMGLDDLAIPRMGLLQDASKAVKKSSSERIDGAEAGMILNSASNELYDGSEGFVAIPVSYRRAYIEWWPRNSTGGEGFVADHGTDASILDKCTTGDRGEHLMEDGTEIVVTPEYFILVVDPETGAAYEAIISMPKSQVKYSKKLNTAIKTLRIPNKDGALFNPAMFYRAYQFKTKPDSNSKGDDFWSWDISPFMNTIELPGGADLYRTALSFSKRIASGEVKVSQPTEDTSDGEGDDEAF